MTRTEEELAWQTDALCAQTDPEAFFPEKGNSPRDAKRVCADCPVATLCLEYALRENMQHGIWGGLTTLERRRLPKPKRTKSTSDRDAAIKRMRAAGLSDEEIGERVGLSARQVTRVRAALGAAEPLRKEWTAEEDALLRELAHLPNTIIGERLRRPSSSVRKRRERLGLPASKARRGPTRVAA